MGQRISIQYSIDIDDLKDEVDRLVDRAFSELTETASFKINDSLCLDSVQKIDVIRQKLGSVDALLQDVSSIVNGYLSYKVSKNMSTLPVPTDNQELKNEGQQPIENKEKHEQPSSIEYSF